ncbi:MAG: endonuclease [Elusimicrobiota bacterium]
MLARVRCLLILLLAVPTQAQVFTAKNPVPAVLPAPAPLPALPAFSASLTPRIVSPLAATPSLLASPVAASKPAPLTQSHPIPAAPSSAPSEELPESRKPATPSDGWASRFNFKLGNEIFDGERRLESDSGAVFAAVSKSDGLVRVHIVERGPLAAVRSVPGTEGLSGRALLDKISTLVKTNYHNRTYSEASRLLFSKADNVVIKGVHGIVDAYTGIFVAGTSENGKDYPEPDQDTQQAGMTVEHTWPQSLFNREFPMRSYMPHLLATFSHPNTIRDSYIFGIATRDIDYENKAGAKRGVNAQGQRVFEPPDAVKGRIARGMLDFYARFKDERFFKRRNAIFWNNQYELFLRWNREFPPDNFEARRNDIVESFHGTRNPFIDDYRLADRIGAETLRVDVPARLTKTRGAKNVNPSLSRPQKSRSLSRPQKRRWLLRWGPFTGSIGPMAQGNTGDVLTTVLYRGVLYHDPMTLMKAADQNRERAVLSQFHARLHSAVNSYRHKMSASTRPTGSNNSGSFSRPLPAGKGQRYRRASSTPRPEINRGARRDFRPENSGRHAHRNR